MLGVLVSQPMPSSFITMWISADMNLSQGTMVSRARTRITQMCKS